MTTSGGPYPLCKQTKTGWWLTYSSEKYEFVSWDDEIPNIWTNNPNVPNHQPENYIGAYISHIPTMVGYRSLFLVVNHTIFRHTQHYTDGHIPLDPDTSNSNDIPWSLKGTSWHLIRFGFIKNPMKNPCKFPFCLSTHPGHLILSCWEIWRLVWSWTWCERPQLVSGWESKYCVQYIYIKFRLYLCSECKYII